LTEVGLMQHIERAVSASPRSLVEMEGTGAQRRGRAHTEIALQRNNIGQLLGKIRDLENDLPEDDVQRIVTENTALKQQVRQLTQDKRRLEERLKGARDNNRFLDKRIADLEAELADRLILDEPRP
jgi:phage shock protein A